MTFYIMPSNSDLMHYGVKGQKWGIRLYQNPDGSLTEAGKERYGENGKINKKEIRTEVRNDNRVAYEAGKQATVLQASYNKERQRAQKAKERLNKKPDSERWQKQYAVRDSAANFLYARSLIASGVAQKIYQDLCNKYGKEAISEIKYDKNGLMNEKTQTFIEKGTGAGGTRWAYANLYSAIVEQAASRQLFDKR